MTESRLLVAKPTPNFLLNRLLKSRPTRLFSFLNGRDCCIVVGRGKLPLLRQLRFLVLLLAKLLLCLLACFSRACLREGLESFSLGPKAFVKAKDLIQQKSRILSAADIWLLAAIRSCHKIIKDFYMARHIQI